MADYNLAGLSTRSFEQLIQAIALKVVSPGVVVFGDGADGGREATFNGLTRYPSEDHPWNGYIVIQAKFRQRPQNSQEDGEWALKQLKSELEDFANPKKRRRQPDYYIFATNVVLTPVQDKGTKDKADDIFQEFKDSVPLKGYDIWDYDKIRVFLDNFEDIRRANAGFITPGDVLSQIMDFIEPRKELFADQYTNLEDIEVLVQKVRSHFDKTIQNECETLCTFNLLYSPMRGNLSQIYVQTKLNESQQFSSEEFSQERRLWEEVVRKNPKLMVLGKPGAGKTTLLQYIAVHCDEVDFQSKLIPVFISLKTLAENAKSADEISLIRYISKKYCRSHVSEKELEVLLDNGRLLFLLDGLDEVTEDKIRAVVKEINRLVDEYSDNHFILSCRKEHKAYKSKNFGDFILSKVANFEQKQIEDFIKSWFDQCTVGKQQAKGNPANQLIKKLDHLENKHIKELADTPLLLHLICLIFQERGNLPLKRVDLYKEAIDLLLEKWNEFNDRITIDTVDLKKALRQIAAITFEKGNSEFEEDDMLSLIENRPLTLSDIEVISGLLAKKAWKIYSFSHQTFQEYLAAEQFVSCRESWTSIVIHIGEERWREIFQLMIEILPNIDELMMLMQQKIPYLEITSYSKNEDVEESQVEYISDASIFNDLELIHKSMKSPKIKDILIKINHKANIKTLYKTAAIRAFYFSSLLAFTVIYAGRGEFLGYMSSYLWSRNDQVLDLSYSIDANFSNLAFTNNHNQLIIDYYLVKAFLIASELANDEDYFNQNLITDSYEIYNDTHKVVTIFSILTQPQKDDVNSHFQQLSLFSDIHNQRKTIDNSSKSIIKLPSHLHHGLQNLNQQLPIPVEEEFHQLMKWCRDYSENWKGYEKLFESSIDEDTYKRLNNLIHWWGENGYEWLEQLRQLIIQHCNIGEEVWFDYHEDYEVLRQYHDINKFIIDNLNSDKISPEVRAVIEDNLFLPLDCSPS